MRSSKVIGGVFAMGLVGAAFFSFAHGLNVAAPENPFCRNPHLSLADQNSCATEMKSAASGDQRDEITNRYQVKINASIARQNPEVAAATTSATTKVQKPHAGG
jgi:hypothetical protein